VVGIQEFPSGGQQSHLSGRRRQLVAETLRAKAAPLFEKIDIQLLTGPPRPTGIMWRGLEAMRSTVGPQDEFVFYVASHGIVATANTTSPPPISSPPIRRA